jgi:hypothetical protein
LLPAIEHLQQAFEMRIDGFPPVAFSRAPTIACSRHRQVLPFSLSALAIMPQLADTLFYSVRSAFIGSNREARQAGARQAGTATASSVATTPDRTTGSRVSGHHYKLLKNKEM